MFTFPRRWTVGYFAAWLALSFLANGCIPSSASTVAAANGEEEEPEPVAVTVFTDKVQLFMEYPRIIPGHEARFLAHVTVLATGEPVRSGQLRLELSRVNGTARVLEAAQPARDGLFIPVGTFDAAAEYTARIVVTSAQVEETIPLQPVLVYDDHASAFAAGEAAAADDLPDTVPFLLEQQWKIGLLMEQVERRSLLQRLQVPGEIEAARHGMAIVSAPLAGRLEANSARLPQVGERVEKGQVLALVEPPLTTSDAAQLMANEMNLEALETELLLREFDLQAKSVEIEQALQESHANLQFAKQALVRIEGLRAKDLGTVAELEAAQRDSEIASRARDGALALKGSFARAEQKLEALRSRSQGIRANAERNDASRHALIAPISGEVISADHIVGESIDSHSEVFRLLDLSRVWITAHVSEFDLDEIGATPGALLELAAYPDLTFDILGSLQGRLLRKGRVVDAESRTITLRYEAANPDNLFHAGMFVDLFLETKTAVDAVALPEQAIVMDNGRPVAFVLVHGEAFQKRALELGIRDGRLVEVISGIQAGDRVVTKGAYLVKLAAASPASFGAGHAH